MRTGRFRGDVSEGGVCLDGVCVQGECLPRGCVSRMGVCLGVCVQDGCLPGVCVWPREGCVCLGAVCLGVYAPIACWDTPPLWTEWLTDRCKNITFPQLRLRAVIISTTNTNSITKLQCFLEGKWFGVFIHLEEESWNAGGEKSSMKMIFLLVSDCVCIADTRGKYSWRRHGDWQRNDSNKDTSEAEEKYSKGGKVSGKEMTPVQTPQGKNTPEGGKATDTEMTTMQTPQEKNTPKGGKATGKEMTPKSPKFNKGSLNGNPKGNFKTPQPEVNSN